MKRIYLPLLVGLFCLPTFLVSQTFSISGKITRHNGEPLPNLEVSCFGTVLTDADGNYEFMDVPLNHTCELMASGEFEKFDDITILDLIELRRHIFNINILGFHQTIAAELNSPNLSPGITTYDAVLMTKLILHMDNGIAPNWKTLKSNISSFGNLPVNTNVSAYDTIVTSNIIDADFKAVKMGDVAISSDYMPAPPNAPSPVFTISDESFLAGEDVQFEVIVSDFSDILAVQQTFEWNPNLLEFISVENQGVMLNEFSMNLNHLSEGLLPSFLWSGDMSTVGTNGEILMKLNFKALADSPLGNTLLSFSDQLTPQQVVWLNPTNNELFILEGEYNSGMTTSSKNVLKNIERFDFFPNPVKNELNVKVLLGSNDDFEILITNVLGQQVFWKKYDGQELNLTIDLEGFPSGNYFLSLKTKDGVLTESVMKR